MIKRLNFQNRHRNFKAGVARKPKRWAWIFSSDASNSETRIELKKNLDYFATDEVKLIDVQNFLMTGEERKIEIGREAIFVSMSESHSKYIWNKSDPRTAIACLVVTGEYEVLETKILKFFATSANFVVDVGANVGYYAVELGKVLQENGKLLAFEPIPSSFDQLNANVRLNKIEKQVSCIQLAISNTEGTLTLYTPKISGSSATSARNLHPGESSVRHEVSVSTLDLVLRTSGIENCDLIKIDVEGAELMVIQGALESIKKFKPVIFAELLRKWSAQFDYSPNEVLELLLPLGYKCFAVSPKLPEITIIDEKTIETNFVFVPESKLTSFQNSFGITH
jgi:FkbM family methyltransferase